MDVAGGVALDGGRSFEDFDDDGRGEVDGDGLVFDEEDHVGGARDQELLGVRERGGRDVVFLVGVGIDEDVAAVGFVGELELLDRVVEDLEADADARSMPARNKM